MNDNKIQLFEDKRIRTAWDEDSEEWLFSVVDVVGYEDENIWLTQKMRATLYGVSVQNIGQHIKRIFDDGELPREATIKKYFIVQTEGARQVSRGVEL